MLPLILEQTEDSPEVILDKKGNQFLFSGKSIPEDVHKLYDPIINWIKDYTEEPNDETIVMFKMTYFNTASTKSLFDVIAAFKKIAKDGKMLIINWHFPEEDDDMLEAGEGLSTLVRLPFNLIKY